MTRQELATFLLSLRGTFAGDLTPERVAALTARCAPWRLEDAEAAVARLVDDGKAYLPTPGELTDAMYRSHGGRGSFRARAALAGMTPAELEARCHAELEQRAAVIEGGDRPARRGTRRVDLRRPGFADVIAELEPGSAS